MYTYLKMRANPSTYFNFYIFNNTLFPSPNTPFSPLLLDPFPLSEYPHLPHLGPQFQHHGQGRDGGIGVRGWGKRVDRGEGKRGNPERGKGSTEERGKGGVRNVETPISIDETSYSIRIKLRIPLWKGTYNNFSGRCKVRSTW